MLCIKYLLLSGYSNIDMHVYIVKLLLIPRNKNTCSITSHDIANVKQEINRIEQNEGNSYAIQITFFF